MSTFRGVVDEFPKISIDFFRKLPDRDPPLASFLSHVHSDHLAGLENKNFHGNFLYCSPATREMLLRLKKYPQRLNFAKGILESNKVTYGHLSKLLKTIPVETPTRIELEPDNVIQVTLFDANHCTGAVMFLIEGDNKAILYTGDIRSEPWFVNNLTRNPFLMEYTSGLKRLDCIYLDTSNTNPIPFPTKADGLKELLQKVSKYPADTIFHFEAWTFGYEEVWMALSRILKSQIHVDDYKLGLYGSLCAKNMDRKGHLLDYTDGEGPFLAYEGPVLTGYTCGNTPQVGCLTRGENVRIHSCEKGMRCDSVNEKTVWIKPIIARTHHGEMAEIGVGGGGGDLTRRLELQLEDDYEIDEFLSMFASNVGTSVIMEIKRMLHDALRSNQSTISLDHISFNEKDVDLMKFTEVLARSVTEKRSASLSESLTDKVQTEALPRTITFPYSRHSSYPELCHLVKVFDPKDVYPCTVDEENWDEDVSMKELFGEECSATQFRHDDEMRALHAERALQNTSQQTHTTATSDLSQQMLPPSTIVHHIARLPKGTSKSFRRDSRGRLRLFDTDSNEVIPPGLADQVQRGSDEDPILIPSTPPHEIIAKSPGSESQNLRRKAIDEGRGESHAKRPRFQFDGPNSSSPAASSSIPPSTPERGERNLPVVIGRTEESDVVDTPGSEADSNQPADSSAPRIAEPASGSQASAGDEEQDLRDPYIRSFYDSEYDSQYENFVDREENIVRCKSCGHEVWNMWMTQRGFCTNECLDGSKEYPYYETIEPEDGPRPGFEHSDLSEVHTGAIYADGPQYQDEDRRNIVGDYVDDHSDAYDTVDENSDYRSEYDSEDSFIDNASIDEPGHGGKDKPSSDGETDYKQLYKTLQKTHQSLVGDYCELAERYGDVMRDLMGSDYESSMYDSEIGDMDEQGALIVNVRNPDPVVAELVLSQAEEQSQESEISAERLRDRAKAFEAADDGGWQDITLVSTGDNHTHEEIEL